MKALRRTTIVSSFSDLGSGLATTLGGAAVLWLGALQVLNGDLTVGSLLVFLAYLGSLQIQLKTFTGIYSALSTIGAKVDRVCEILELEPEVADHPGAQFPAHIKGHVTFENVGFEYQAGRPVLNDISFQALPGQTIAIVGPTGAGKSTLVGLVPRFFDPTHGTVLLDGWDLRRLRLKELREQVSLVLQEPFLFPVTIAENIAYGRPTASPDEIENAARAANAHSFITRLPQGYNTIPGERGATLSGGERQRLSIARALLKNSPILILDEPTSALDAVTEQDILQAMQRLVEGRTTFIIAHRLSTIRRADSILVLEQGRIAEAGSHAELLQRGGLYAQLHAIQFGRAVNVSSLDVRAEAALEAAES
jgi:ATP-binding cassette subfamily B protein